MIRHPIVFGIFALASLTAADFASAQVPTNAAMKALAAASVPYIQRAGYYAPGDGGGALYRWDQTSTCTDDGGSCIKPNRGPAQGRWILDQNGAVSVKVFGAKCDGGLAGGSPATDDTAAFNNALAATTAVFVPANVGCGITLNSASDGIKLNNNNHLYGQNQQTSVIKFTLNFTPSYDWAGGVGFTYITVASGVGTVTTGWSHGLKTGQTVTIVDSTDTGVGGSYSIASITAPDKFTISMPSAANGTYCPATMDVRFTGTCATKNITGLTTPSGIGVSLIRSALRDTTSPAQVVYIEMDHLSLASNNNPQLPFTWIDATGMQNSTIHDIQIQAWPGVVSNGQIGLVCADQTPNGNQKQACFFNHFYDISTLSGPQTMLHWGNFQGNSGVQLFERFSGSTRVMIDTTSSLGEMGGLVTNWYFVGDNDANSWDIYPDAPHQAIFANVSCEGCTNGTPWSIQTFAVTAPDTLLFTDFASVRSPGGLVLHMSDVSFPWTVQPNDYDVVCSSGATSNITLPGSPARYPQGGLGGQILNFRAKGGSTCNISGGASFTGSISGTTLTVSPTPTGRLAVGYPVFGTGIAAGTVITALGTGTGGAGTYTVNNAQTVGSEGMTAGYAIDGSFAPYILNWFQSLTLQFFNFTTNPAASEWRIISQPAGQLPVLTVGTLPSCGSAQKGLMYAVSDASSPTYNGALMGSGSSVIPVFCNGTAWTTH
jgi:hypothetical protein